MIKICHPFESEEAIMDEVHHDLTCSDSHCEECGHGDKLSFINADMDWPRMEISPCNTPYGTPLFSRESSFSSFASCFSSLDDSIMDTDTQDEIELQDNGQFHLDILLIDEFTEQGKGNVVQVEECQLNHANVVENGASFPILADQNILSSQFHKETDDGITMENVSFDPHQDTISNDHITENQYHELVEAVEIKHSNMTDAKEVASLPKVGGVIIPLNEQVMDQLDTTKESTIVDNNILDSDLDMKLGGDCENGSDYYYPLELQSFDTNPLIWLPPEPANKEDDTEIVDNKDDDSDNNGTQWGLSSFNISFDEERSKDSREDQLQKAMSEVMNGPFKILVSRFLAAEGFSLSDGGTDKSWLDIVASLSWDAALFIKPDASVGNEMDPGLYVKVKCIGSGSRKHSEVIKGLIFKKSVAHKQMRTNIRHPKLLLIQGAIGQSSTGLSSMNSMKQENEQLEKTLNGVIGKCQPDVILVEKAVSRNVNEYFQKQQVTVVSDMHIHRLERTARCAGSPIISLQDVLNKPNLVKQCQALYFKKFIEEHNITGEDEKRPSKSFLFLEGFPKPLGCTILLKGSTSEELKKIKRVLHFTVFAAYHLILETSFFADQFSTEKIAKGKENHLKTDPQLCVPSNATLNSKLCSHTSKNSYTMNHDLSITASGEQSANQEGFVDSEDSTWPDLHHSNIKTARDHAHETPDVVKGIQSYSSHPVVDLSTNLVANILSSNCAKPTSRDDFDGSASTTSRKEILQKKETSHEYCRDTIGAGMCLETRACLNSKNILILMSSQHIMNQSVCEQSHLSRITYYGYFDTSLGRYLQDTLLNEKHHCLSCVEPPEAHMYCYTHHNGTLTVLVKSLPLEATLSGEGQGRIWMWTRCLRCNGKPTQRVIISSCARKLSFGKFLELSFSTHSAAKKLPTCGHLLHRDCLRFFGLGSKVAIFRYSSVEIYSACKPPLALDFNNPNKKEWFVVEAKKALLQWESLLSEIEYIIDGLRSRYSGKASGEKNNVSVCGELLLNVTMILAQEKNELEAFDHIVKPETYAHEILSLNWLYQQLLLAFYIWDVRLHHLDQYCKANAASSDSSIQGSIPEDELKSCNDIAVYVDTLSRRNLEMEKQEATINSTSNFDNSFVGIISCNSQLTENLVSKKHGSQILRDHNVRLTLSSLGEVDDNASPQVDTSAQTANANNICSMKSNDEHPASTSGNETYPVAMPSNCFTMLQNLLDFKSDDTGQWVWNTFRHMEMVYRKELQGGFLDKFHLINKHIPVSSSLAHLKYQMNLMHFTVGPGGNILSIAEDEISSIIACALALSEQQGIYSQAIFEKDEPVARRKLDKVATSNLVRDSSVLSMLSLCESLGKDNSNASMLSYEESTSGFYDSFLSALKDLHPEICLNSEMLALKSKYTVVCIYAEEFYDLRKICCPSELAYISSLCRCRKWNAQGGKSKVFFAKSVDDRFIIKQIKKTEFDSFLKFGLEYFKHFAVSQVSSNPTCLAKILGIYQVKKIMNGKEKRTNFMVMENLLFGHNILRRYDLKGALFSRHVPDSKNHEKVMLDQNFIEDMRTMPIYVEGKTKNLLERAIWNDTSFLSRMNVMDYSLFVGVDKQKKELVFGIIDYLRQYTWDKQLESWVKTSLVVPRNLSPTVISPKEYKIRFRTFMSQYFLSVPDDLSFES